MQPLDNVRKKFKRELEQQKNTQVIRTGKITISVRTEKVTLADLLSEEPYGEEYEDLD